MRKSFVVVAVCLLLGPALAMAAPVTLTGFDQPPLLVIHWNTDTIAGELIETSVVIHTTGATEITEMRESKPAQILRGIASNANFRAFNAALAVGQVALEKGGCGNPTADGPIAYEVTWYGQGSRFNTFKVGADLGGCAPGLTAMIETILKLVNDVRPAPGTQTFPRPRKSGHRLSIGCNAPEHDIDLGNSPGTACNAGST
jgi:hypothetical protein